MDFGDPIFRRELVAVRLPDGEIGWRQLLSDANGPVILDSVGLLTGEVLAVSSDSARLYLWRATKGEVGGIAAIDAETRAPVAYSGPWNVAAGGLVPLVANSTMPEGALALVGERGAPGPRDGTARVYLLHPTSLVVMDSIGAAAPAGEQDIWQVVPAPGGRIIYVAGSDRLVQYDLIDRRALATAERPASGPLILMPGGETLVLTDGGGWPDSPGSGLLWLFGLNLEARGTIDVSTPLGGAPGGSSATRTGQAAFSRDGHTLFVGSGSQERGPLYPAQPARLLVIDVQDRKLLRAIELGGYGLRLVLPVFR